VSRPRTVLAAALVAVGVVAAGAALARGAITDGNDADLAASGRAGASPTQRSAAPQDPSVRSTKAPPTRVQAWRDEVLREYSPLAQSSLSAVRMITEWNLGRATAADVAGGVEFALTTSQETVRALAVRTPLPGTQPALTQYRAGAGLYVLSMRTVLAATALPDGDLQSQLRRAAARQRDLGDRLFDLAATSVAPLLPPEPTFPGVRLVRPPDVPDYAAMDLGVGPPLEAAAPVPGPVRTYQDVRPDQAANRWVQAVADLDVPSDAEYAELLRTGASGELAAAARRLVAAADRLHRLPDPRGARGVSNQVQLGLLVAADGLRAAQAATMTPTAERRRLQQVAQELGALAQVLCAGRP
jgi:hypothetical protein